MSQDGKKGKSEGQKKGRQKDKQANKQASKPWDENKGSYLKARRMRGREYRKGVVKNRDSLFELSK